MKILVDVDGVLKDHNDAPIATGVVFVGTLSVYNKLTFMTASSEAEVKYWLDTNKIVDFDEIIDASVKLEGESLAERQIKHARSRGQADLFITNNPHNWVFAFELGIPAVMFAVPAYTRPEFRPDAPRKVRAWSEIEETIRKQNELRTKDARLTRTESLNFE